MAQNTTNTICELSTCSQIGAQVNCVLVLLQGTNGFIDVQFIDSDGTALDLSNVTNIDILLFDEFGCSVADFKYPDTTGSEVIQILQVNNTDGTFNNKGIVRLYISTQISSISPGNVFAEIRITEGGETGQPDNIYGISCIWVMTIKESKIYQNEK